MKGCFLKGIALCFLQFLLIFCCQSHLGELMASNSTHHDTYSSLESFHSKELVHLIQLILYQLEKSSFFYSQRKDYKYSQHSCSLIHCVPSSKSLDINVESAGFKVRAAQCNFLYALRLYLLEQQPQSSFLEKQTNSFLTLSKLSIPSCIQS